MSLPNPYTILFTAANQVLHVAALSDEANKINLINFTNSLGATRRGDWYILPTHGAINSVVQRTQQLGGVSYFLAEDGKLWK